MASNWEYPSANALILQNICNALVSNPQFYYQTLNFMRSLNLPAPFSSNFSLPVLYVVRDCRLNDEHDSRDQQLRARLDNPRAESDSEDDTTNLKDVTTGSIAEKRLRICSFAKMRNTKQASVADREPQALNDVFDIEKRPSTAISINIKSTENETEVGCKCAEVASSHYDMKLTKIAANLISDSELALGRLCEAERAQLKLLQNYTEGEPSERIYVKNVEKNITEEQLRRLYGRYVDWTDELAVKEFSVQLLTAGRMRGQAFVKYISMEQATLAVRETNTFRFMIEDRYTKPLIVQFAKCTK